MAILSTILAVYTIVPNEDTVRMWAFPEQAFWKEFSQFSRELLRFKITQKLADKLPEEIVHFEFRIIVNSKPPFGVDSGGFWTYFHPGVAFTGAPQLFPARDQFIQEWKKRTGQILE